MKLSITGYSTALFSTWYFIEELGLLLDAGDGVSAALLQKARKIENIFISHADRDHLTGLLQLNQLNAREGFPRIHYPSDCGSFPALEAFSKNFDPHVKGTLWFGIKEHEHIKIKPNMMVQAIKNHHVKAAPSLHKSLSFQVYETKQKLKPEYLAMPKEDILKLMTQIGKENMTELTRTNLLTYSGDTPIDRIEKWNNTKILIHEATFLDRAEHNSLNVRGNSHSNLEDVLQMVAELNIETLILGHFSSRYSQIQIDERIRQYCKEFRIQIPVFSVLPGQVHRDILGEKPIN